MNNSVIGKRKHHSKAQFINSHFDGHSENHSNATYTDKHSNVKAYCRYNGEND